MILSTAPHGQNLGRFCALVVLLGSAQVLAQTVSVAPARILLDGGKRSATVFLSNRSSQAETYRISLTQFQMLESGAMVRIDSTSTSDDYAGHILRYSPRRVVIPPGGSQTVRLLLRRPPDRPTDNREFRAHLSVRSIPMVPRLDEIEDRGPQDLGDNRFAVRPVASIQTMVPIVVRFGNPQAEMAISEASIDWDDEEGPVVQFDIERRGDRSLYGNLTLTHRDPQGKTTPLHQRHGIAIYTPLPHRTFRIGLSDASVDLRSGSILIEYEETPDGGGDLYARAEVQPTRLSRR
jgi:P pilus assembly chaperone PapD